MLSSFRQSNIFYRFSLKSGFQASPAGGNPSRRSQARFSCRFRYFTRRHPKVQIILPGTCLPGTCLPNGGSPAGAPSPSNTSRTIPNTGEGRKIELFLTRQPPARPCFRPSPFYPPPPQVKGKPGAPPAAPRGDGGNPEYRTPNYECRRYDNRAAEDWAIREKENAQCSMLNFQCSSMSKSRAGARRSQGRISNPPAPWRYEGLALNDECRRVEREQPLRA